MDGTSEERGVGVLETRLSVEILPQPDDFTCGPTSLHSLYRYYNDPIPLEQVIHEVPQLQGGGTMGVVLACHALRRGYDATIYTYNLQMFDPTWFMPNAPDLAERLKLQKMSKESLKLQMETDAYLEFLHLGGHVRYEDLTTQLIRRLLNRKAPVLTGLSSTYLYRSPREFGPQSLADDVRGEPGGHFVVICGYDKSERMVLVADPLRTNPVFGSTSYLVCIDRLIGAILLGILTYDANLLIITPKKGAPVGDADPPP